MHNFSIISTSERDFFLHSHINPLQPAKGCYCFIFLNSLSRSGRGKGRVWLVDRAANELNGYLFDVIGFFYFSYAQFND